MTAVEGADPVLARHRMVLEQQRDALRHLMAMMTDLRRTVPRNAGEWRSLASRRYTERLLHLDDTLESAVRELAGGASAASVALARLGAPR
ncbi:hypothetical protein [Planctomonas psychrotolerans]|uniref:hypothetical protein n=1 Tax=Planctomonas psychrotolerans TaxID=2528712 RepID=UPI00123930DB|nr:hypothetical protein [Planctomonas psychrotolerans]